MTYLQASDTALCEGFCTWCLRVCGLTVCERACESVLVFGELLLLLTSEHAGFFFKDV